MAASQVAPKGFCP